MLYKVLLLLFTFVTSSHATLARISLYNGTDSTCGGTGNPIELYVSSLNMTAGRTCYQIPYDITVSSYMFTTFDYYDGEEDELEIIFSPNTNCQPTTDRASYIDTSYALSWQCQTLMQPARAYSVAVLSEKRKRSSELRRRAWGGSGPLGRIGATPFNFQWAFYMFRGALYRINMLKYVFDGNGVWEPLSVEGLTRSAHAMMFQYTGNEYGWVTGNPGMITETITEHLSSRGDWDPVVIGAIMLDAVGGLLSSGIPTDQWPQEIQISLTDVMAPLTPQGEPSIMFLWISTSVSVIKGPLAPKWGTGPVSSGLIGP